MLLGYYDMLPTKSQSLAIQCIKSPLKIERCLVTNSNTTVLRYVKYYYFYITCTKSRSSIYLGQKYCWSYVIVWKSLYQKQVYLKRNPTNMLYTYWYNWFRFQVWLSWSYFTSTAFLDGVIIFSISPPTHQPVNTFVSFHLPVVQYFLDENDKKISP